jgi:hypothetical protein
MSKHWLKLALLAVAVYAGWMYYAGSNNILAWNPIENPIRSLPTYSGAPRGGIQPIGTPGPGSVDAHGVLQDAWPTDPFGKPFYPLGYPNNTSYPLLQNNYPV